MVDSAQLVKFMLLNTIGLSALTETLKMASRAKFTNEDSMRTESQQCYMFIQGTGLDMMIARFDLGYDADHLRLSFNYYYRHKDLKNGKHNYLSSSGDTD